MNAVWILQMCWCHDPPPTEKQKRWASTAALLDLQDSRPGHSGERPVGAANKPTPRPCANLHPPPPPRPPHSLILFTKRPRGALAAPRPCSGTADAEVVATEPGDGGRGAALLRGSGGRGGLGGEVAPPGHLLMDQGHDGEEEEQEPPEIIDGLEGNATR